MSKEGKRDDSKIYWSVIDGKFRTEVPENHPEVEVRHWKVGQDSGTKYERSVDWLDGVVTEVSFYEGESGNRKFKTLNIVLDADEKGKKPVITTGVKTKYAEDMLKKLPGMHIGKEVRFRPFSFVSPEHGDRKVTGMFMAQSNGKGEFTDVLTSAFHFRSEPKGQWKVRPDSGYPLPEGDTSEYSTDDWKLYFLQVSRFLVKYCTENIIPKFMPMQKTREELHDEAIAGVAKDMYPEGEINPDDIPF